MANNSSTTPKLTLGQEYPQENEPVIVGKMIKQMQDQLEDIYQNTQTLRQVHSKMHGCLKAEFIIEKGLHDEYKVGVFKEAKSYPAWVRLSNGKTHLLPDKQKDTRGFAIKLMNVPGEKLLVDSETDTTQDFIFASAPIFFAKNLDEFHGLMTASISKNKLAIPLYFIGNLKIGIRTVTKLLINCKHALGIPYFSVSPYRFGDKTKAVKYVVKPTPGNILEYTDEKDPNYLKTNLVATLAKHDISYDFFIQFQTDADKMPIEDGTVEWTSPLIKLATIKIPKQSFDSAEQTEFGENLTYNAWHSLAEHQPLGGFNRGRKAMYEALYTFRLSKNKIPMKEPTAGPDFFTSNSLSSNNNNSTKMSNLTNTDIVKQLFQFYAEKNIAGFMSLLNPEVVWVEPGEKEDIPYSGTFTGMAGIGQMMGIVAQSVDMISFQATEFCANDTTVNAMGYNEAKVKATGKTYKTDWVYSFKIADGKVTYVQVYMDTLTMAKAFKA